VLAVLLPLLGEVGADGLADLAEGALVSRLDVRDGEARGGLHVDERAEAGLALDNAVGHAHLAAERRQPDDNLDRVDIVGNDDQLGLLLLNQASDVVDAARNTNESTSAQCHRTQQLARKYVWAKEMNENKQHRSAAHTRT
jgi:hypothetical protein